MARDAHGSPLDDVGRRGRGGRAIPYRPSWNRLTGSVAASILLQQMIFRWCLNGRRPFYKFATPCPSARPGDSWTEELGFTEHQFETARVAIATKIAGGTSRAQALETALVIYWTDHHRKTWYHVNEPLLLRRLAELDDPASPASPALRGAQSGPIPENQEYMSKPENRLYMSKPENRLYMITPDSAITCTENIQKAGADKVHVNQDLVDALARLGLASPHELVAGYPDRAIRHWVDYCDSPLGRQILDKAGFIRFKLELPARLEEARQRATPGCGLQDAASLWQDTLAELRLQMTKVTFTRWFFATQGVEYAAGTLRVAVPDRRTKDWLDHRLRATVDRTLSYLAGGLAVEFVVAQASCRKPQVPAASRRATQP